MAASTVVSATDLRQIATDVVARAMKAGATGAEAVARESSEFSTTVRMGQVETLQESDSRGMGLRAYIGQRTGSSYTSDFSEEGVQRLVKGAIELARITSEDPFSGMPEAAQLGQISGDLQLYYEDVNSLEPAERIEWARRAEKAAMDFDPRIRNSDGGSFDAAVGHRVLANSHGFVGEYKQSHCSIVAVPIAQTDEGAMQRDFWYSRARTIGKLDTPEVVGKIAAQRTLRRLGARKIASMRVPLVFDSRMSASLLGHLFEAVSGESSFLAGRLGEKIAGENITIIDDGTMPGGFGTAPFDDEGVPSQRTVVMEKGVLKSYLLNTYTAKKLGLKTTGNASRALASTPSVGNGNFFLEPGVQTPEKIIGGVRQGLYVTELLGYGVNLVTGDFSQGASGLWIENGELAYPVEEITVAGNFKDILNNIAEIGNDLEFRSSIAGPTLRVEGMTIAGE
jgi:PmbA protein